MNQYTVTLTEAQLDCILTQLCDTIITIIYLPKDLDFPYSPKFDEEVLLGTFNLLLKIRKSPQITRNDAGSFTLCPPCTPWQKQSQGEISG